MVRCQIAQSLKACLSVQTVNMCSKYLDVISRRSESLKPVIDYRNEPSTAIQSRLQDDDSSTCAVCGGGGKHTHPGTRWWLVRTIQSWLPLYAGGFTYTAGLGSARPRDTNGLNGELNVGEWIFAHILIHFESSWVRKKDGKLKNWPFWGVVEKITHFDLPKHQQQQLHFLTTWKEQQQGLITTLKQLTPCTQRSFAIKGSVHSTSTYQQNWWKPDGLYRWWPGIGRNSESFVCRSQE